MTTINTVTVGSVLSDPNVAALTPDALMIYLSTRLNGLDAKIQGVFQKQQDNQHVHAALNEMHRLIGNYVCSTTVKEAHSIEQSTVDELYAQIEVIRGVNPQLADKLKKDLNQDGQIFADKDHEYWTTEVAATKEYLSNITKELESQSQLDMIGLQSDMSARQTAIQLATNLISALGESTKSIAANIGS
jgi:hypothetical protein